MLSENKVINFFDMARSRDRTPQAFFPRLHRIILLALPFSLFSVPVTAQIIPDNTLPNNSVVTPNGNSLTIDGGTSAGNNLFHSFREFSLPRGSEAFFNNAGNIQNIFSRVTGGKISNIDGLIRANGSANLFLINPSGILFGPNARLNIGGSFLGTTASSIVFKDGFSFNATNPQVTPLLTVNVPIGLQFRQSPNPIQVQGQGHGFTLKGPLPSFVPITRSENITGLQVKAGQTLALIGGDINLSGGTLTAAGGRIELGGVNAGQVNLALTNPGLTLDYEQVPSFRDINLQGQAGVDASGLRGGSIQLVGRQIRLTSGSMGLIQNLGPQPSGNLTVNAYELLEVSGTNSNAALFRSGLVNETLGTGSSGEVAVSAPRFLLSGGGQVVTRTFGSGTAGNVLVNASDSVDLQGFSPINPTFTSILGSIGLGVGKVGNTTVLTRRLTILDGAIISTVSVRGSGQGGNITVNASDSVRVSGLIPEVVQPATIGSSTFSAGNAGDVTINTVRVMVQNGGAITSSTFAQGSAGNLTINASDSVEVTGKVELTGSGGGRGEVPSGIDSSAIFIPGVFLERFGLTGRPSGNSGNVTINTPRLTISDGAQVSVGNQGTGIAGSLNINARDFFLNNQGSVTAFARGGEGGNIELQIAGDTILRNGSRISAEAGGTGNGGNLTANTNTLTILEGSKVTANAFQGNGGNIRIATQGLFSSSDSSITASSNFGVSGSISINNPNLDPSSGLVELPQNVVDPTTQIAQGCTTDEGNTFTVAGRGGLPESPTSTLRGQTLWQDLENYAVESKESHGEPSKLPVTTLPEMPSFVEAVSWQKNANGDVELVANLPNGAEFSGSDRASIPNCPRQKVER